MLTFLTMHNLVPNKHTFICLRMPQYKQSLVHTFENSTMARGYTLSLKTWADDNTKAGTGTDWSNNSHHGASNASL